MKVVMKDYRYKDVVVELSKALTPESTYEGGIAERAQAKAELNAEVLGNLAALLVEKGVFSLDEAKSACNVYGDIEVHHEPMPYVAKQVDPKGNSKWAQRAPNPAPFETSGYCSGCGSPDCNGECAGDDMMGSSS